MTASIFLLFLSPQASAVLRKLDPELKSRIRSKIIELKNNPHIGTRLKYSDYWRLRIGDYRAIYKIDADEKRIRVLFIGHRENVYDDFSRIF